MNETETPTEGRGAGDRDRLIVARRRVEETRTALEQARRSVGVAESEASRLRGQSGHSAESGHQAAEALRREAEAQFREGLREYLPQLRNLVRPAPDPPPPEVIANFLLARSSDADEFFEALREAIDADVLDGSTSTFTVATEAEVAEAVAAKRRAAEVAREQVEQLEAALQEAEVELREAQTEGR